MPLEIVDSTDSASGTAKAVRDPATQAIFPLRGKVLNLFTASASKAIHNEEIVGIINALGFDFAYKSNKIVVDYNPRKLRYGKFIILADRDPDGAHIQMLILSCLWNLVPQMILDGYVYIALPALYKVEYGTEYVYLQDKYELDEWKKKNSRKKFTLSYYKGIGESSPEEVWDMILNPQTRRLQQVSVSDAKEAEQKLKDLMGKDVEPKRKFVFGKGA